MLAYRQPGSQRRGSLRSIRPTFPILHRRGTVGTDWTDNRKNLMLFAGRAHPELADQVAKELDVQVTAQTARDFANGEIFVRFEESVRGCDAFVLQSHPAPLNKWLMEQLIMIEPPRRGSAKRTTAILPFYPYARQDKKHRGREPISARLVADLLKTAGRDRIVTVGLHTDQIQGFFDGPVDHMRAQNLLIGYIKDNYSSEDMVVVSPDSGRVRVAEKWADALGGVPLAFIHKTRDPRVPNQVVSNRIVGDVGERTCILIDDMIDTGGTIAGAVKLLHDDGACDVIIAATHGVLSAPAAGRQRCQRGDRHQHAAHRRGQAVPAAYGLIHRTPAGQYHSGSVRKRFCNRSFRRRCLSGRKRHRCHWSAPRYLRYLPQPALLDVSQCPAVLARQRYRTDGGRVPQDAADTRSIGRHDPRRRDRRAHGRAQA